MFRQNTSSPKTWSLTCCKKWTWRRDASKFGELILWVACSTKTLLLTRIKAFHIFPHTVASNVVFRQKYVLSEKHCLGPVIKIVHKYLMSQNFGNILFHFPTIQNINIKHIWNHAETHRFSPQVRLIAYPDHKTTLIAVGLFLIQLIILLEFSTKNKQTNKNIVLNQTVV